MTIMIPAWRDGALVPVEKMEVHRDGLRHKAVSVFVTKGSEILLQQRAMSKYHTPGLWANTCCTHPSWDETPMDCAVRRLRQELGLKGLTPEFRDRIEYRADVGAGLTEHEVVDVFVAKARSGLVIDPDPEEVMATRWVDLDELVEDVAANSGAYTPWLRIYLENHIETILGVAVS